MRYCQIFFSVDHEILKKLLWRRIADSRTQALIANIINSFQIPKLPLGGGCLKGIPIGNLTSQLFANVYMNELDQFVKHELKVKYYARYTDDFVIVHENADYLRQVLPKFQKFLDGRLCLSLHPKKIILRKFTQGIDFLGYVVLPYRTVLRTKTKQRMFKKMSLRNNRFVRSLISRKKLMQSFQSYAGCLKHCRGRRLMQGLRKIIDVRET